LRRNNLGIGGCDANPPYSGSNSIVTERKNSLNKSHPEGIFTGNASSVSHAAGKKLVWPAKDKEHKDERKEYEPNIRGTAHSQKR
jgi:hypothetical protein